MRDHVACFALGGFAAGYLVAAIRSSLLWMRASRNLGEHLRALAAFGDWELVRKLSARLVDVGTWESEKRP